MGWTLNRSRATFKVKSEVAQLCPTLCDPVDCSPPGSSVHGILQARILEWVAISFSRGSLPDPGIEPRSPALQADTLTSEPPGKPKEIGKKNWGMGNHASLAVLEESL